MPYASDKQRRYLHWAKPEVAAIYDRHEKHGGPTAGPAQEFMVLRDRGLVGISDRVLQDHLGMYARWCDELAVLDAAVGGRALSPPAPMPSGAVKDLLGRRVRDLPLQISGKLEEVLDELKREFTMKGIRWFPNFYLGEADFWTTDRATSVNVPWYLADDVVWSFVNGQDDRYEPEEVLAILRHELGHALGYAYELWRGPTWRSTFGDIHAPYLDEFTIDPQSRDYVQHLHSLDAAANAHYAQKHPDEDWAETFAVWLDPGSRWRETYADWPGALAKLEAVETMLVGEGAAYGPPAVTYLGKQVPYTTLDYTVGEYLGQVQADKPDPRAAALRRLPEVYDAVVLHELYFGGLERGAGLVPPGHFGELAGLSWAGDFRAAAEASGVGWVLAVWDRRDARVRNVLVRGHDQGVPAGCDVLVALDMFEHSYAADYGARRDAYVAAWWRNVSWAVVNQRLDRAFPPVTVTIVNGPPVDTLGDGIRLPGIRG